MMDWKKWGFILAMGVLCQAASNPPEMALIEGGTYVPLYSVGEKQVSVSAFLMDRYPVTNQDFAQFIQHNPKWKRSQVKSLFAEKDYLKHWSSDQSFDPKYTQSPVNYVSWFAAKAYCKAQGKTLPTEAQWEFVGLASENKKNDSRNDQFRQRILDWYGRPTPDILPQVHTGFKNAYGIHGMHGLSWEWVKDFNTVMVTGESREDTGIDRKLYCAGGASGSTDPNDYAAYMRYAYRSSLEASYTVKNLGFRCAKEME